MKLCSTCKIEKHINEFNKNKWVKSGFDAACKLCKRLEKKRYKEKNREKVLEDSRIYGKKRYHENKEKELERNRNWRKNNPEIAKLSEQVSSAKSYQKHKIERLEKARIYRQNNREKIREQRRKYKDGNREYINNKNKEYISRYPEKKKAVQAVNNAIMYGKIVKPEMCSRCPCEQNIEGHHSDYSKPLDVIWLCRECHNKEHGK